MAHIPKPFQRPSVDLGGAKKAWKTVSAEDLEVGDLIKGSGLIEDIKPGRSGNLRFYMASSLVIFEESTAQIEAFVKVAPRG